MKTQGTGTPIAYQIPRGPQYIGRSLSEGGAKGRYTLKVVDISSLARRDASRIRRGEEEAIDGIPR
jgi:hypothetical protein